MKLLEEIQERLHKYPDVKYEIDTSSISVLPVSNEGFTVRLDVVQDRCTVSFNGWHEEFQRKDDALNCFAFGLSDECRLEEVRRGNFAYRWTVESMQNGKWVADSETGFFFFPFWKKKEVRYLQNRLISSGQEEASSTASNTSF
jgi:hypothetical protein